MKDSYSIEIAASPERVFQWLGSSERAPQWLPNLVESEDLRVVDGKVGSTFRHVYLERGRRMEMQGEVTAYEANRRFASELRGELFDLTVDYRLDDLGGRTRLTQAYETRFKAVPMRLVAALMRPFMRKMSRRQLDASLGKLKALAEAGVNVERPA